MNPLDQYPEARKYLYMFQWVVNGVLAIAGIIFTLQGTDIADLPQWYVFAVGIAPFLWTYLGITAQTNVGESGPVPKHLPAEEIPPAEPVVKPNEDPPPPPVVLPPDV